MWGEDSGVPWGPSGVHRGWVAGGTCSVNGQASSGLHPGIHQKSPNMLKLGVK